MSALGERLRQPAEAVSIPLLALAVSAVLFGLFVGAAGADAIAVYQTIWRGAFGTWFSWQNTLTRAAPLMLTALCTALPARVGLLVIGGEGALVLGGLAAVVVALPLAEGSVWLIRAAMLAAALAAGGLWVMAAGLLRQLRGVNETISTLLLNYIAIALLLHCVSGPLRDPASLNKPATLPIPEAAMLGDLPGMDVHWGLAFGLIACAAAYLLYRHGVFGFAASVVGGNADAARVVGLSVGRQTLVACFLGGAAAGLAGMVEVAAVHGRANDSLIAGYGYSGILVAFLARHNPLAIMPIALLIGGIGAAGGLLQRRFDLPDATVLVLQGLVFLAVLVSDHLQGRLPWSPAGRT